MVGLNWGTVPDWLAAIGTVGSLIVALAILKNELRERHRREDEKARIPAQRVSAWCLEEKDKVILAVKNGGEEPVYDCMLYVSATGDFSLNTETPYQGPHETLYGTIPPGETLTDERPIGFAKTERFGYPFVEVEFTDTSGKHWRRESRGVVKQIPHRHPFC